VLGISIVLFKNKALGEHANVHVVPWIGHFDRSASIKSALVELFRIVWKWMEQTVVLLPKHRIKSDCNIFSRYGEGGVHYHAGRRLCICDAIAAGAIVVPTSDCRFHLLTVSRICTDSEDRGVPRVWKKASLNCWLIRRVRILLLERSDEKRPCVRIWR